MGLDSYLIKYKGKNRKEVDFKHNQDSDQEIHYWRKHPNLEGFMADLYFEKGGQGTDSGFGDSPSFNCCKVELKEQDITTLQELIISDKLPKFQKYYYLLRGGFFHGNNSDAEYKEETLEALKNAMNAIEEGYRIYYTSWW